MMGETTEPTRRGFLGHVAGAYLAVGAATMVALADPVFAAITAHSAAMRRVRDMHSTDDGWDAAFDEEGVLWEDFCACRPTTIEGLAAYAAHAAAYPDIEVLQGSCGLSSVIRNMADALKGMGK